HGLKAEGPAVQCKPVRRLSGGREAGARALGGARQAERLCVRRDVRSDRHAAMMRLVPAILSVAVSLGAALAYLSFLRVPAIRNHPALYLAGFALGAALAAPPLSPSPPCPHLPAPPS